MEGKLLAVLTRLVLVNGKIEVQIYVPDYIANLDINKERGVTSGWHRSGDCNPKCKEATADGYELCIGGVCVFFPY